MIALGLLNWQTDDEWSQDKPSRVEASPMWRQTGRHNCLIYLTWVPLMIPCSEEIISNQGTWWNYSTSWQQCQTTYRVFTKLHHLPSSILYFLTRSHNLNGSWESLFAWLGLAWLDDWLNSSQFNPAELGWTVALSAAACSYRVANLPSNDTISLGSQAPQLDHKASKQRPHEMENSLCILNTNQWNLKS